MENIKQVFEVEIDKLTKSYTNNFYRHDFS